jgi:hypothetical protein
LIGFSPSSIVAQLPGGSVLSTQAPNRPPEIPSDVLTTPPSQGRFGFLVAGEFQTIIQGSDGQWYERDGDTIALVTRPIPEGCIDYED